MTENLNLCMGCMEHKSDYKVCPHCGYVEKSPYLPSYLAPATILNDRYIVGKLLSYNGEGALYMAYDQVTNHKIFIKEYMPDTLCSRVKGSATISVNPKHIAQYKAYMAEFTDLNKTLAKMRTLSHINPALDLFAENNTTYVVLEYIDGVPLKKYIQDNAGELTWEQVKILFPPILTTISLIHNAGIVHRGISLDTIWVTSKNQLKLTGFSIIASRTANTDLASEIFAGYAAPEQYSSTEWQGTWTDVYGISALLYRILTGCMPTEAISRIGNDNLVEPAKLNTSVPSNVSKTIMSGLKLSTDTRIQTITEFVTKLFDQPEYMNEKSKTATIAIPKQKITPKQEENEVKNTKLDRVKIPLMIGLILFGILLVFSIVLLVILSDDSNEKPNENSNTSIFDTLPSDESSEELSSLESKPIDSVSGPKYIMENLVGKIYDVIKDTAYTEFFTFVPTYEYNEKVKKGEIFEQNDKNGNPIEPGKEILVGSEVHVKISLGSQFTTIPEYQNKNSTDYFAELDERGIAYKEQSIKTDTVEKGYVVETSIEPGTKYDILASEKMIVYVAENDKVAEE